ncbi:uncharacterized protein EV422DRAFT_586511 [Fimicolochytrium jonesii]|uniref:uncharacterized protein n=1 Tax=Fimicolochytrium jonesii TaxID=1396493 RepID=UPI0022FF1CEA|nr:uncharacterized protein EV422DRAFT_586511 [Fimicolochytrium jonesii]KAI8821689.1 hypothetical protein EV422DRAFT_586511 [Fimicolochytrium jonesii]
MAVEQNPLLNGGNTLQAIRYSRGSLLVLNQLLLPFESVYEKVEDIKGGHHVIQTMKVRGAPAIAIVAALSLAIELHTTSSTLPTPSAIADHVHQKLSYLKTSRPTAVNLFEAADRLNALVQRHAVGEDATAESTALVYIQAAEAMLEQDVGDNRNIGMHGAEYILTHSSNSEGIQVLTHCNTGSLATAGWGTALGIIRELHARGNLSHAFCTETRPYNQGSRLTAYELVYERIPATLICDSMVSHLLRTHKIAAIVVGADRVAANGDTANKIGTYQLAITARYHNVPFIVAAPTTSIDLNTPNGDAITIEERSPLEVVQVRGRVVDDAAGVKEHDDGRAEVVTETVHVAAPGVEVWNPAFDVAPAGLISAIVTERGVCVKGKGEGVFDLRGFLA